MGTGNIQLSGDAFQVTFTVNTKIGAIFEQGVSGLVDYGVYGGTMLDIPSPVTATLTINNHSIGIDGSYLGAAYNSTYWGASQIKQIAKSNNGTTSIVMEVVAYNSLAFPSLTTLLNIPLGPEGRLGYYIYSNGSFSIATAQIQSAGSFVPSNVSVTIATPVPSSWGMALLGFLLIGLIEGYRNHRLIGYNDGSDLMIAATALEHGLTVVTRNVSDFAPTGAVVLDPFR